MAKSDMILVVALVGVAAAGVFLFKDQLLGLLAPTGIMGAGLKDCVKQKCQKCLQPGGGYCSDCAASECGADPESAIASFVRAF